MKTPINPATGSGVADGVAFAKNDGVAEAFDAEGPNRDDDEAVEGPGDLAPPPKAVVATKGASRMVAKDEVRVDVRTGADEPISLVSATDEINEVVRLVLKE